MHEVGVEETLVNPAAWGCSPFSSSWFYPQQMHTPMVAGVMAAGSRLMVREAALCGAYQASTLQKCELLSIWFKSLPHHPCQISYGGGSCGGGLCGKHAGVPTTQLGVAGSAIGRRVAGTPWIATLAAKAPVDT